MDNLEYMTKMEGIKDKKTSKAILARQGTQTMTSNNAGWEDTAWRPLFDGSTTVLKHGCCLRFQQPDRRLGVLDYAFAIRKELSNTLSFFGPDGWGYGYGRSELPIESLFEGQRYSLSVEWLRENFNYIVSLDDISSVQFSERIRFVPIRLSEEQEQ